LRRVKKPYHPTAILFETAVDLMFEIYLLRGDCSVAAKALMARKRVDENAVEDCARLDDTLAKTYRALQATLKGIQASRRNRSYRR
jgi:hypothetical protein